MEKVFLLLTKHDVQTGQIPNGLPNARSVGVYRKIVYINQRHLASPGMRDLAGFRQAPFQLSWFEADLFQSIRL